MKYTDEITVEQYLDITFDDNQSAFVASAIEGAEDYIDKYCKRKFNKVGDADTVRLYDGNGSESLVIDDFTEITSLSIDDIDVAVADLFLYPANEDTKYKISLKNTLPRSSRNLGGEYFIFDEGQQNIEVTGKFGFKSVPDAIVLATTRLAGAIIKEATGASNAKETSSESFLDYKVTYQNIKDIANFININTILDQYIKPNEAGQQKSKSGFFKI